MSGIESRTEFLKQDVVMQLYRAGETPGVYLDEVELPRNLTVAEIGDIDANIAEYGRSTEMEEVERSEAIALHALTRLSIRSMIHGDFTTSVSINKFLRKECGFKGKLEAYKLRLFAGSMILNECKK